jgi:cell division protein FtsL
VIRLLNICVIVALVAAASYVYKIKFESTRKAEQVARLRLDIQELAQRHLTLRMIDSHQFDPLDHLPERPPDPVPNSDPIGNLLEGRDVPTASVPPRSPK